MSNQTLEQRDGFKSKWGFILACIGSAVGMGNIWRFPIMVSTWGGLTFLIPYFIFVVLIGASGVIEEFALGRRAGAGPVGAFGMCTEERTGSKKSGELIGAIPIIGAMMLAIGYTVVLGWIFKYTWMSISGSLYAMGQDMSVIGPTFGAAAPEANTLGEAIGMMASNGFFGIGNGVWQLIGLVVSLIIMAMGIAGGIEKANKIMMPVLFFLFVALAIYIATLPGASEGYKYIFTLNPAGLLNWQVWLFAFGQAFFSLSVAGNGSVIYGSYLPNVLNGMPGGRIVGMIFFIAVLFAGLSSIVNLYEAPVAFLQEKLHLGRNPSVAIIGGIGAVISVMIQPWTSQWMDLVSVFICPLGAVLAGVMFFWVLKKETALDAVNEGRTAGKKAVDKWFYPLGKYGYCLLALIALIGGAAYFLITGSSIG